MILRTLFLFLVIPTLSWSDAILVPMDDAQTNHLKAYGVAYWALQEPRVYKSEWLLNYRGGSFLIYETQNTRNQAVLKDVTALRVSTADIANIHKEIELNNMDAIPLEKAPKMAVYAPPTNDPWDDAVTLALTYAEIPYDQIWDEEVLVGALSKYDWLHLHHEDFTGQYGKFYRSFNFAKWYQDKVKRFTEAAHKAGYAKVQDHKLAVAKEIRSYVNRGGFMFAMCAATDTLDIALAAQGLDIVAKEIDGDGVTPSFQTKLNYANDLAFKDFTIIDDPMIYEFSDIDTSPSPATQGERYRAKVFQLFDFSAKFDPVPTMLTQNHVKRVDDFLGQTTAFRKSRLKSNIITLADFPGFGVAKYIHGVLGEGTFTFLGGHDPEDAQHLVGEEDTDLSQHPHSPGYRLILNNVLFPAAKKKPRKT